MGAAAQHVPRRRGRGGTARCPASWQGREWCTDGGRTPSLQATGISRLPLVYRLATVRLLFMSSRHSEPCPRISLSHPLSISTPMLVMKVSRSLYSALLSHISVLVSRSCIVHNLLSLSGLQYTSSFATSIRRVWSRLRLIPPSGVRSSPSPRSACMTLNSSSAMTDRDTHSATWLLHVLTRVLQRSRATWNSRFLSCARMSIARTGRRTIVVLLLRIIMTCIRIHGTSVALETPIYSIFTSNILSPHSQYVL